MENVEYVTIRVAVKTITADDGNLTVPVESIGPVCAAYWLTYGARQSVKDKVAGADKALTELHHVITLGDATPKQTAAFRAVCEEIAETFGAAKVMNTETFVATVLDVRKAQRWAEALAEKMYPVEESRRLKGDAKMARDIATYWVRQAYEQVGKKVSAPTFEPDVDKVLTDHADKIAAEIARRKAMVGMPDLSGMFGQKAA